MNHREITFNEISIFDLINTNIMVSPLTVYSDKPFYFRWSNKRNIADSNFASLAEATSHPFEFPSNFIADLSSKLEEVCDKGNADLVTTRYNDDGTVVTANFELIRIKFDGEDSALWIEQNRENQDSVLLPTVILRYINQPIVVFDKNGKDLFVSPEAYKNFKKSKTDYQINEIIKLLSPGGSVITLEDLTSSSGFKSTFSLLDENNLKKYFIIDISSSIHPSSGLEIFISVFTDITSRVNNEHKILESKNEIENILANIHQGIFKIDENLNIMGQYSKYLEEILETEEIQGANIVDLLLKNSMLPDYQSAVLSLSCIGMDSALFDLNAQHLPKNLVYKAGSKEKELAVDWTPLLIGDTISSILVSVRDNTELKKLEKEASKKELMSKKILKIVNVGRDRFADAIEEFENHTSLIIEILMNEDLEEDSREGDPELEAVFRYLHTIKGNSKALGLETIAKYAHETEELISDYNNSQGRSHLNIKQLQLGVECIVNEIDDYKLIHEDLFENAQADKKYEEAVSSIKLIIDTELNQKSPQDLPQSVKNIAYEIFKLDFDSLEMVLELELEDLKHNARQLEKDVPTLNWKNEIWIPKDKSTLFRNIFGHLLRNSIEHGIEKPESRSKKGKQTNGEITFEAIYSLNRTSIYFQDDGRGLNIKALRLKKPRENMSKSEIAELIFHSGVSTSKKVTDLSGRGVGMDAVREFIRKEGGEIHIQLLEEKNIDSDFIPFRFVMDFSYDVPRSILEK